MLSWKIRVIAAILVGTATSVFAQTSTSPPAGAGTPAPTTQGMPMGSMPGASGSIPMMGGPQMGGMPMMGMMQVMMGQGMAGHVEGRIAFLKTELKITDAQMPLWNAVADAMRVNAKEMAGMMPMMQSMMQQQSSTLPEKLATREKTITAHLEAFRKFKTAVEPLYAILNDEQKKTADQLLLGPMGMGMI
jgi:LTXXQ motif family protein